MAGPCRPRNTHYQTICGKRNKTNTNDTQNALIASKLFDVLIHFPYFLIVFGYGADALRLRLAADGADSCQRRLSNPGMLLSNTPELLSRKSCFSSAVLLVLFAPHASLVHVPIRGLGTPPARQRQCLSRRQLLRAPARQRQ